MILGRLAVANHRGALVPRVLGIALAAAALGWTLAYDLVRDAAAAGWGALAGTLIVFGAGLVDDLAPPGPRGLRNHMRALASGRMTTGILKFVAIVGASVFTVALQPRRAPGVELAGAVLVAASANVWNGLDVRPGRALKAFLVPALVFLTVGELVLVPEMPGLFAAAIVVLPLDLRERAMLGDSGANLLGFAAGLGLYAVLTGPGVVAAALLAVALNVVGETVSFSRVIDGAPPLRWIDRLGRTD
jgi:hypothetical protein